MKFQLNDRTFYIHFYHDHKDDSGNFPVNIVGGLPVGRATGVEIHEEIEDGTLQEVITATAYCSLHDNFSRLEGRKHALAKAVKKLWETTDVFSSKEDKRLLWETYFQNFRKV